MNSEGGEIFSNSQPGLPSRSAFKVACTALIAAMMGV
jgi:hypothetical protein